jgi:hypothetical protein
VERIRFHLGEPSKQFPGLLCLDLANLSCFREIIACLGCSVSANGQLNREDLTARRAIDGSGENDWRYQSEFSVFRDAVLCLIITPKRGHRRRVKLTNAGN